GAALHLNRAPSTESGPGTQVEVAMKLKELTYNGRPSWSPTWRGETDSGLATPVGEIGNLAGVVPVKLQSDPDPYLRVFIEHEGKQFLGDFRADDRQVVRRVYEVLVSRIGALLARMGDLEIED